MPAFLRLAIQYGLMVRSLAKAAHKFGTIRLVYPQIEDGRVIADAVVAGLGDYFVNERIRVWVSAGERSTIIVPGCVHYTRAWASIMRASGRQPETIIDVGGARWEMPAPRYADALEILSGL